MISNYIYVQFPTVAEVMAYLKLFPDTLANIDRYGLAPRQEVVPTNEKGISQFTYYLRFTMKDSDRQEIILSDMPYFTGLHPIDNKKEAEVKARMDAAKQKLMKWVNETLRDLDKTATRNEMEYQVSLT